MSVLRDPLGLTKYGGGGKPEATYLWGLSSPRYIIFHTTKFEVDPW